MSQKKKDMGQKEIPVAQSGQPTDTGAASESVKVPVQKIKKSKKKKSRKGGYFVKESS